MLSRLFVLGGTEILSSEEATQGDPLTASICYWHNPLCRWPWWDIIVSFHPKLGYNPNASKSWLVVKPQAEQKAWEIFGGTSINVTTEGRKSLGGFIESESGYGKYAEELVSLWCFQLTVMWKIAKTVLTTSCLFIICKRVQTKLTYYRYTMYMYIRRTSNIKNHMM